MVALRRVGEAEGWQGGKGNMGTGVDRGMTGQSMRDKVMSC